MGMQWIQFERGKDANRLLVPLCPKHARTRIPKIRNHSLRKRRMSVHPRNANSRHRRFGFTRHRSSLADVLGELPDLEIADVQAVLKFTALRAKK